MARIPGLRAGSTARRPVCPKCKKSDQTARMGDAWYCARCQKTDDARMKHIELPKGVEDTRKPFVRDVLNRSQRRRAGITRRK